VTTRTWRTRDVPPQGFAADWTARLAQAPHASFALRADLLAWEAVHGREALAALVDDGPRRAALVLRFEGGRLESGWPWRAQAVLEGASVASGLSRADASWVFGQAERLAGGRRLEVHLPHTPENGAPAFRSGGTLVRSLAPQEDELMRTLDVNKRRAVKRAIKEGYRVLDADRPAQYLAFARLQRETEARRGVTLPAIPEGVPAKGESWREWEHPWQWLLVAQRGDVVEAGSGFGVAAGATIDYRANASTLEAKKLGANALLAWEALRRGRERGYRWMNWGGTTEFKRELGGETVEMWCWLGGGVAWALPNRVTASLHRARPRVAAWWKSLTTAEARR